MDEMAACGVRFLIYTRFVHTFVHSIIYVSFLPIMFVANHAVKRQLRQRFKTMMYTSATNQVSTLDKITAPAALPGSLLVGFPIILALRHPWRYRASCQLSPALL